MEAVKLPNVVIDGKKYIAVPPKTYQALIRIAKNQESLEDDLAVGLKEIKQGKAVGPFGTVAELRKSLES